MANLMKMETRSAQVHDSRRAPSSIFAILASLVLVLVGIKVLLQMNTGFWLDESISYWSTNAGLGEIVDRCTQWTTSVVYSLLIYALRWSGAAAPWAFRLPSLLAMVGSVVVLFRMVKRLADSVTAWTTIAAFVSLWPIQFAAGDARPYALGMLAALLSTSFLLKYLDRPSLSLAGAYAVMTALVIHLHFLLGACLLFQLFYVGYLCFKGLRIRLRDLVFAIAVILLLILPVAKQFLVTYRMSAIHSFSDRPHAYNLVETFFPTYLALALLPAFAAAAFMAFSLPSAWTRGGANTRALAVFWAFTPALLLYTASTVSNAHVFLPRFFLPYAPGLALCMALIVGAFDGQIAGIVFVGALAALAARPLLQPHSLRHTTDVGNWGGAIALVNQEARVNNPPVLVRSQFLESNFLPPGTLTDNAAFAPFSYYPTVAQAIPLPSTFSEAQRAHLDELVRTTLGASRRFLFVGYNGPPGSSQPFLFYLEGRLGEKWQMRDIGDFDGIVVTEFAVRQ